MGARLEIAVAVIDRLAKALNESGLPPERPLLEREVARIAAREAPLAGATEMRRAVDEVAGLGPLEDLLRDPAVTDVLVNGPDVVWVERAGELMRTDVRFDDDAAVMRVVERVLAPLGLHVDRAAPMVSARLPDGSRIHAVVPPASPDGPIVAIRRFAQAVGRLDDLVVAGAATPSQVDLLRRHVAARSTVVVSGGTGAGKTTLLNLLGREIPEGERVVVIEDASELSLAGHVVRLEARPANGEGAGEVTLRSLVRTSLRLRPDRIVLGEVRGPEALDLVFALNTGHRGSLTTVHANGPAEAIWRLETLALSGPEAVPREAVARQLASAIDVVVQLERDRGLRRIAAIEEL
jgi:pilus assembly protein CpaF